MSGVTSKVVVKDKGYKKLMQTTAKLAGGNRVRVGVFGSEAAAAHGNGESVITVGDVANWLENGTDNAPPRYWLAGYIAANGDRIKLMIRRVTEQITAGKLSREQGLRLLGLQIKGEIQARISNGELEANAPSTIARKGSSVAGIDTGQFRASVTSEVVS